MLGHQLREVSQLTSQIGVDGHGRPVELGGSVNARLDGSPDVGSNLRGVEGGSLWGELHRGRLRERDDLSFRGAREGKERGAGDGGREEETEGAREREPIGSWHFLPLADFAGRDMDAAGAATATPACSWRSATSILRAYLKEEISRSAASWSPRLRRASSSW